MEIILIRHGKSSHTDTMGMTCSQFSKWINDYDAAGITKELSIPQQTKKKAQEAKLIVTSNLKRSIQSAQRLNIHAPIVSDSLFREAEMPVAALSFFPMKAPPSFWAFFYRCAWLAGYKGNKESMKEAQQRAVKASEQLIHLAAQYDQVLVAGHGIFNRMIARELKRAGWSGAKKTSRKHWDCTIYTLRGKGEVEDDKVSGAAIK
ncbi:histidine phosphatase family protein [Bacillus sp. B190/17]|uniref:Histidine phosphatase family protein n=1 Tax=Bacillus lumedeiriae TaxID=3058829 RepID=A0ABW8I3M8_9BACI